MFELIFYTATGVIAGMVIGYIIGKRYYWKMIVEYRHEIDALLGEITH
uniref:Uncharacterized protein n=1 Tax=viral metagenome TaxID=1070528 RepID=A0A6H1ZHT6_9ZZZZ